MDASSLTAPRYTQPDVLAVTRLKPAVLQTWINRNAIALAQQNPGRGRSRLYSPLDVMKLAIMRRMADLRIDLAVALEIAEAAAENLATRGAPDWNQYIFLRPDDATERLVRFEIIRSSGTSPLAKYDWTQGDPAFMRVSDLVEPDRFVAPRRPRPSLAEQLVGEKVGEQPVDPGQRDGLARKGIHAEPVIVFPLGEIVNGTLAQLAAIDEREG